MHIRQILNVLGALWIFLGVAMLLPVPFALYYGEGDARSLVMSAGITAAAGFTVWLVTRGGEAIRAREGFAIVTLGWVTSAAFGTLPFILSGTVDSFVNAYFESISGFTTTGATILTDIEKLPRGILFWRSLTHWLGGMGIIVFSLAILPLLGIGATQLYKAEAPGPVKDRLTPRVKETAKMLWMTYVLISAVEVIFLWAGGMDIFDSICHTFGTMATGGFSTKNASIAHYNSAYFDYVIIVFMVIAGANFALHYKFLTGGLSSYSKDKEFQFYIVILLSMGLILTLVVLVCESVGVGVALRKGLFQAVAIITTTGYTTTDFERWIPMGQMLILTMMFVGGCSGSTGGSMKVIRVTVLLKHAVHEIRKLIHPTAVYPVRLGEKVLSTEVIQIVLGFFLFYMAIFVSGSIVMTGLGMDLVSGLSATASALGNVGPALGSVGPTDNYYHLPAAGKIVLSFCMLLGRLELFTVIVLFSKTYWKGK